MVEPPTAWVGTSDARCAHLWERSRRLGGLVALGGPLQLPYPWGSCATPANSVGVPAPGSPFARLA